MSAGRRVLVALGILLVLAAGFRWRTRTISDAESHIPRSSAQLGVLATAPARAGAHFADWMREALGRHPNEKPQGADAATAALERVGPVCSSVCAYRFGETPCEMFRCLDTDGEPAKPGRSAYSLAAQPPEVRKAVAILPEALPADVRALFTACPRLTFAPNPRVHGAHHFGGVIRWDPRYLVVVAERAAHRPGFDAREPVAWAVLAHEYGHYLDDCKGRALSRAAGEELGAPPSLDYELWADLVAGCALASRALTDPLDETKLRAAVAGLFEHASSETHPRPELRFRAIERGHSLCDAAGRGLPLAVSSAVRLRFNP